VLCRQHAASYMPSDRDVRAIRRAIFSTHHHALAAEPTLQASLAVGHMVTRVDEDGTMFPAFTLRSGPAPQAPALCALNKVVSCQPASMAAVDQKDFVCLLRIFWNTKSNQTAHSYISFCQYPM